LCQLGSLQNGPRLVVFLFRRDDLKSSPGATMRAVKTGVSGARAHSPTSRACGSNALFMFHDPSQRYPY